MDNNYKRIDNQDFIDACTITMEETLAMNLDTNTDKEPENYYIYNRVTSLGNYHGAGNYRQFLKSILSITTGL